MDWIREFAFLDATAAPHNPQVVGVGAGNMSVEHTKFTIAPFEDGKVSAYRLEFVIAFHNYLSKFLTIRLWLRISLVFTQADVANFRLWLESFNIHHILILTIIRVF